jgi:hypothetical protein
MKPDFAQLGFIIEETSDGSPTLRLADGEERMHHSGGAAAETNYIYTHPLRNALAVKPDASTCVVGLGLGYIEMAWALCRPRGDALLFTYEVVSPLKNNFRNWIFGGADALYDRIADCLQPGASIEDVKSRLATNYSKNDIRDDIRVQTGERWNIVCFDAFSTKTSADLWSDRFFSDFFEHSCAEDCVFTTYGCTGVLKRSLLKHGFTLVPRKSFSGKRDSTLAVRGAFTSVSAFRTF